MNKYELMNTIELLELSETATIKEQKLINKELSERLAHATTEYID